MDSPSPALHLTFDDGPDELWTPRMLSGLERCRARATFFMVGERVLAAPVLARAVLEAGHEVQLHCHRHIRHTDLSESEIDADTHAALEAFVGIGVRPTHWRTPWGIRTRATLRVAERHSLELVNWTIDTHDWRGETATRMLDDACARLDEDGGEVILMHDALGPGALRTGCESTVELLAPLIAAARERGLEVRRLSAADPAVGACASSGSNVRASAVPS